jgi:uncharacterized protein (TIGR03790 family)
MKTGEGCPMMIACLAGTVLLGCSPAPATPRTFSFPPPAIKTDPAQAKRVLLVINDSSPASQEVGAYYRSQRMIPGENVLRVQVPDKVDIQLADYERLVEKPVREKIKASKNPIDFIVLTKGTPFIVHVGMYSLDALLAGMDLAFPPIKNPVPNDIRRAVNPYFNRNESFSSKKYGFYLVCRLDGYSVSDAKALVANSLRAKPHKGPFLLDADPTRGTDGYKLMQDSLLRAADVLKTKGFEVALDEKPEFAGSGKPVAGYASWGSNDRKFGAATYRSIRFLPGALAETFVSTSGRAFSPQTGGQSLIADLIASGVTGVKGYVSEPYTFALAKPDIFFDRYTSGFNLAESFYMGSMVLKWKDVVIGDPLCSPYEKGKP